MKLVIQGKNIDITPAIREYVEQKVDKAIAHYQSFLTEVDVCLSVSKNPRIHTQTAEVTIFANGSVIRAEEGSDNLYASVDLVANKISRQLRKYKERLRIRKGEAPTSEVASQMSGEQLVEDLIGDRQPELPKQVVRTKYFAMAPMSVEEALEQLELVDHDFYVFLNAETNEINVAYERNHGGYGVIQPRRTEEATGSRTAA